MGIFKKTENKSINIASNDISGLLTGFDSGIINTSNQNEQKLINNGYGSNVTVFSIINKIVTTASNVDIKLWDNKTDEEVISGDAYNYFQNPAIYIGEFVSFKEYIEVCLTYLLTSGNLYQRKLNVTNQRLFDTLEIIPSGIIEPIAPRSYLTKANSFLLTDKYTQTKIDSKILSHLKYVNPTKIGLTTLKGLSPLQAGLYSLTGSTDVQKALSVLIKNQGVRGLLTNKSGRQPNAVRFDSSIAQKLKDSLNRAIRGVDKVNSVHITGADLEYLQMGMSANDLKLIESGVLTDRQLCNLYGVDSKLFNDPSSSTFNNLNEATKGMYTNAILPNLSKLIDNYNNDILKDYNAINRTDLSLIIDTSNIEALQQNQKEKAEKNRLNSNAIAVILNSNTDINGKIESLIYSFGMSEEQATKIVGNGGN